MVQVVQGAMNFTQGFGCHRCRWVEILTKEMEHRDSHQVQERQSDALFHRDPDTCTGPPYTNGAVSNEMLVN